MNYQESDLYAIVAGERDVAQGLGAQWMEGKGIMATRHGLVDEVWKHPYPMALPFPFTKEEFKAFCNWHPTFEWEAITSPFSNDDDTLDEAALSELAGRGADAADLVRLMLISAETKQASPTANGMTTKDISVVFDGLPFAESNWPKRVSGAKWLKNARLSLGARGGAPSIWCPFEVAQASYEQASKDDKPKRLTDLNRRFKSNVALAPWKDRWDDFYSMFSDSD